MAGSCLIHWKSRSLLQRTRQKKKRFAKIQQRKIHKKSCIMFQTFPKQGNKKYLTSSQRFCPIWNLPYQEYVYVEETCLSTRYQLGREAVIAIEQFPFYRMVLHRAKGEY